MRHQGKAARSKRCKNTNQRTHRSAPALLERSAKRVATTVATDLRQALSLPSAQSERPEQGQRPVSSHLAAAHLVLAANHLGYPSAGAASSNQTGGNNFPCTVNQTLISINIIL